MESNLVNLRLELHRKRAEAQKFASLNKKSSLPKERKLSVHDKSNAGVEARSAKDIQQEQENEKSLQKSRDTLDRKAALYEKLHDGIQVLEDDKLNEKFLVNFQRKIFDRVSEQKHQACKRESDTQQAQEIEVREDYMASCEEEEWVEYTDVLGRTRTCLCKDLPEMKKQDQYLAGDDSHEETRQPSEGDYFSEKMHQKWELEEEISKKKKNIHYQDVHFDEARAMGTGYMKFSRDEEKRKAQMDLIKELHKDSLQQKAEQKASAAEKKKALEERLAKVRQRKRLKLGLPIRDTERKLETPPASDEETECTSVIAEEITEAAARVDDKPSVREWDVGKEATFGVLSQMEWIEKKRQERYSEFAPPSLYNIHVQSMSKGTKRLRKQFYSNAETTTEQSYNADNEQKGRTPEFAPPATYEYYGPSTTGHSKTQIKHSTKCVEESINKGLTLLRKQFENKT